MPPAPDHKLDELACRAKTGDTRARDELARALGPIVERIARKLARKVPAHMLERDDLEGIGTVGLLRAINTYDDALGVPFKPYAIRRIAGEMIDAVRKLDPVPHPTRRVLRIVDNAGRGLHPLTRAKAIRGSKANEAGVTPTQLGDIRDRVSRMAPPRHIDERVAGDDADPLTLGDTIIGGKDPLETLIELEGETTFAQFTNFELEVAMCLQVDGKSAEETAAELDLDITSVFDIKDRVAQALLAREAKP